MRCNEGLGDKVEAALMVVGITHQRVEKWLGRACGCKERVERLNSVGRWASRVIRGKVDRAKEFLEDILHE